MHLFSTAITSMIVLITAMAVYGQQQPPTDTAKGQVKGEPKAQTVTKTKGDDPAKEKDKLKTSTDEEAVVTHHRIELDGKVLAYTATTGLMPLKDAKGEVEARIFFVAYTRDDSGPPASRALMFSFNGGPGSASVWLHLGDWAHEEWIRPKSQRFPLHPFALLIMRQPGSIGQTWSLLTRWARVIHERPSRNSIASFTPYEVILHRLESSFGCISVAMTDGPLPCF